MKCKNLFIVIFLFLLQIVLIFVMSIKHKELVYEYAETSKIIDSLKQEILVKDIELGRYEYTYENIDSTCQEKIDSIYKNTE